MKQQIEYVLARELKKALKQINSDMHMGHLAGPAYVNEPEVQWWLGKAEGLKFAIRSVLKEKDIDEDWFLCKIRSGPMPARYRN